MQSSITLSERTRVLLVDDNVAMLDRATAVLSPSCAIVGVVKDGPAALEAVYTLKPDVIVLDISMPGMSGLDVAQSLKATGSTAAVVFLTVHGTTRSFRREPPGSVTSSPRLMADLALAVRGTRRTAFEH